MVDAAGIAVEGVEGLDDRGDKHNQGDYDQDVDGDEGVMGDAVPAKFGVLSAENSLGKEEIDHK